MNQQLADIIFHQESVPMDVDRDKYSSKGLESIWNKLHRIAEMNQCILLILDGFEGFALSASGSNRVKQGFLYNVFDMLQSASIQMGIICISSLLEVSDILEKRIRSRFSHRVLLFTENVTVEYVRSWMIALFNAAKSDFKNDKTMERYLSRLSAQVQQLIIDNSHWNLDQYLQLGYDFEWIKNLTVTMNDYFSS